MIMATGTIKKIGEAIKMVEFGWVASPSYSAGAQILAQLSPSNSVNSQDVPIGYTFKCWLTVYSVGWVGAPYFSTPKDLVTSCWTPTAKPGTNGASIRALALYVRNDLA